MKRSSRLKREVATGQQLPMSSAGGRRLRPNTGTRQNGLVQRWIAAIRAGVQRAFAPTPRDAEGARRPSTMTELLGLAWPIAAGMLGETALGLVDTKLVGGLGPEALGGVGMATMLLFLGYSMTFGLMRGVKVRAAYAFGAGHKENAIRYAQVGVIFGLGAGVFIWLICRDLGPVLGLLRVDPSLVPATRDYLAARSTGAVGTCAVAALIQYRQGIGDSRTPMIVGLAGNLLNALLAYALIYGKFGLPALGVKGAGYGTAITETLELLSLLALVAHEQRKAKAPTITVREAAREVAGLGGPTALHFGFEVLAFTTFTAILGSFGAAQMAAHQITMNTIRVSFLPGVAVAEAASVLVARALAKRRLDEADQVTRASLTLGIGFMSVCGVLFALFGASVAHAFSDDPQVVSVARQLFFAAAIFQTLDAVNIILRGALRGAKDVRWVAVVGTTIVWVTIPGAAFVLGRLLGWGAFGGWVGFIFETSLGAWMMWRRWSRGPWRRDFGAEPERSPGPGLAHAGVSAVLKRRGARASPRARARP
jgi:MATE family multidrug resistance protein